LVAQSNAIILTILVAVSIFATQIAELQISAMFSNWLVYVPVRGRIDIFRGAIPADRNVPPFLIIDTARAMFDVDAVFPECKFIVYGVGRPAGVHKQGNAKFGVFVLVTPFQ